MRSASRAASRRASTTPGARSSTRSRRSSTSRRARSPWRRTPTAARATARAPRSTARTASRATSSTSCRGISEQRGFVGHVLGGWQMNAFFTLQSGSPFTPLLGSDPTGALASISGLVGNSIRPNLNTTLDLPRMSVEEIVAAGGRTLFRGLSAGAARRQRRPQHPALGRHQQHRLRHPEEHADRREPQPPDQGRLLQPHQLARLRHPASDITSANFLNQWGTNGGNRRVIVGLRYVF